MHVRVWGGGVMRSPAISPLAELELRKKQRAARDETKRLVA